MAGTAAPGGDGDRDRAASSRERVRVPAPLISKRLPSGCGATEQPNNTGDGDAPLTVRFWLAVVLTGVATGLFGDLMMVILVGFEHLAFGTGPGAFQSQVERASAARRVLSLTIADAFAGPAWYLLRKHLKGKSEVDEAVWAGGGRLAAGQSLLTGAFSELAIGMGASIGREAAPKLMGGVSTRGASLPAASASTPRSGDCLARAAPAPGSPACTTSPSEGPSSPPR